jgi:lipid-A-disaccharide synthase
LSRRILMVAGEASGDALGACLAAALKRSDPTLRLYGVGGDAMRAAGVDTIIDTAELSVMGFAELGREIGRVLRAYRELRHELRENKPDLFVPIDFPDFNLPLCRVARKAGVPVFYYVSPQVWAWRQKRIETIARTVTRMLVLFPFEVDIYRSRGVDAHFVGHPLAENLSVSKSRVDVRTELGVNDGDTLAVLLPGSRRREVKVMLPIMLEAAALLDVTPVVAEAPMLPSGFVGEVITLSSKGYKAVACRRGDAYNLLAAADLALVTSGTATLESALAGCPMVVAYRMSRFSYELARRLVRVPFIAMPNLLLGREVVGELVQDDATAERIVVEAKKILDDPERRSRMTRDFAEICRMLTKPGAADRAAALAMELLA